MRLALFGGSFDPIHRGHVEPVLTALRALDLDRVIYLPTASPPHKTQRKSAPASARFTMVELALLEEPRLEVSDFEMTSGGTAYTIDSIEHFSGLDQRADLVLLIGLDSLAELPQWRRFREIVERVEIGVLARPGVDEDEVLAGLPRELLLAREADRLRFVENPPVAISSTRLRRMLAAGDAPPTETLAPLVLQYLQKYPNLYV